MMFPFMIGEQIQMIVSYSDQKGTNSSIILYLELLSNLESSQSLWFYGNLLALMRLSSSSRGSYTFGVQLGLEGSLISSTLAPSIFNVWLWLFFSFQFVDELVVFHWCVSTCFVCELQIFFFSLYNDRQLYCVFMKKPSTQNISTGGSKPIFTGFFYHLLV